MIKRILLLCLGVLSFFPALCFGQMEVREIPTRENVTVRFVLFKAESPVANAILMQGGGGNVGIYPNGSIRMEGFLSSGAHRFTRDGINVVIPDAPSDRSTLNNFRNSPEHAEDLAALIAFLRKQNDLPIWVVGTSNGSLSAATAASMLKERGPDGIVLTSSTTVRRTAGTHPVTDAALEKITAPTLFVHHKDDTCFACPYEAIPAVMASMKSAKVVELITIEGGTKSGNPCHSSLHQFLGIEDSVTQQIVHWMKSHFNAPIENDGRRNPLL